MEFCSVCGRKSAEAKRLYCFPRNPERAKQWIEKMNMTPFTCLDATSQGHQRICDRHFTPDCFQNSLSLRLNCNAIPSVYPVPHSNTYGESSSVPERTSSSSNPNEGSPMLRCVTPPNPIFSSKASSSNRKRKYHFTNVGSLHSVCTTPQNKALANIIKTKREHLQKLKKLCIARKNNLKTLFDIGSSPIIEQILQDMPSDISTFIISQFSCPNVSSTGCRWTLDEKILSLVLFQRNPKCYSLLRSLLSLPSKQTLHALLETVPFSTGINSHLFEHLRQTVDSWRRLDRMCILTFDEMSIKKHIQYNRSTDSIVGLQDHGNGRISNNLATHALVFMVQGVTKKWKQPIAYYFHCGPVPATQLKPIILEVVDALHSCNLQIVATVCDMGAANVKAYKDMGCSVLRPYFIHNSQRIYTMFDPPSLLKSTRNLFHKYPVQVRVDLDGTWTSMVAHWEDIVQAYEIDQACPYVFKRLYKITDGHLTVSPQNSMKVNVAAVTMSHSVASYIYALRSLGRLRSRTIATATFIQQVDALFDSLNGSSEFATGGKPQSCCATAASRHRSFWKTSMNTVRQWRFLPKTSSVVHSHNQQYWRPPSQLGWLHTIQAMQRVWNAVQKKGVTSLRTRSFNIDALENLFGSIRSGCSCIENPTTQQFVDSLKTQIINGLANQELQGTNCEEDGASLLSNLRSFLEVNVKEVAHDTEMVIESSSKRDEGEQHVADEIARAISEGNVRSWPVVYATDFIIRKYFTEISCGDCRQLLTTDSTLLCNQSISNKDYSNDPSNLICPSDKLVRVVGHGIYQLEYKLPTLQKTVGIQKQAMANLRNIVDLSWITCTLHSHLVQEYVVGGIVGVGIPWYCTRAIRNLNSRIKCQALQTKRKLKS